MLDDNVLRNLCIILIVSVGVQLAVVAGIKKFIGQSLGVNVDQFTEKLLLRTPGTAGVFCYWRSLCAY